MAGDILSIPEAAAILGVSRIAVFKRVKSGAIPAFRVGRSWAIARTDIKPPAPAKKPSPSSAPGAPAREDSRTEDLDSMGWD
ncbi:MAG: helix-turn-helix domain-containing protein [Elusimicrobiales bacterium]|nr:helix-turn-helix domain-containing protein [Elusimicrobiales bacterium]